MKHDVIFDFSAAEERMKDWFTPAELSSNLKDAALRCAIPDMRDEMILKLQEVVLDVCDVLDAIKWREVRYED